MQRCVAHLDMDAFYVGVELMRRPELRGRPVVVAGTGPRAVVTTASYEARRYGVFSAIPAARARRLCPEAVFLPPDFEAYTAMSKRVMNRVRAQVDTVEVAGLDEAYLDLSGIYSPRAAMRRLISEIKADTGLGCSVGIGPNRLVAKVASDAEKPEGFVVLSRELACKRFAGAAPRLLPGIGAKTAERLEALGIETIAQLAATPPETLAERFGGRLGPYLRARARFEDETPVTSRADRGLGVARDDVPDRHRRPRRADRRPAPPHGPALRRARQARPARADDRDQGAPRRLHDRHARPHDRGADERRRRGRPRSPARCSTSTRRRGPCGCWACAWRHSPSLPRPRAARASHSSRSSRSSGT